MKLGFHHIASVLLIWLLGSGCNLSQSQAISAPPLSVLIDSFNHEATMDFDSADFGHLQPRAQYLLRQIAAALKSRQNRDRISIEGNCGIFAVRRNSFPLRLATNEPLANSEFYPSSEEYGVALSGRMALAVREYLIQQGAAGQQLLVYGLGTARQETAYPSRDKTAAEWNKAANANNRICLKIAYSR
jgi:outer membrane protein OmpA-like peptidoglycan-associated protein